MNEFQKGSEWRVWDLQVQTILDDGYVSLQNYSSILKAEDSQLWDAFTSKVGGEENAILFDSKEYFGDTKIDENERCLNYSRNLFAFVTTYKPNLGLIGFTDHNYSHPRLLDALRDYGLRSHLKTLTGVEINACGVHMLLYFDKPPCQKSSISAGIISFLDLIKVNNRETGGALTVSSASPEEVLKLVNTEQGLAIFPHCNSSNGLFQERGKTDRTHLSNIFNANEVIFLQASSQASMSSVREYVNSKSDLFKSQAIYSIASDSRRLLDIGASDSSDANFWIKANPTFKGFCQVYIEPSRAFIGDEPNLLKRVRVESNKFIKTLKINPFPEETGDKSWFDNFEIAFNSGLIAIIGNKGSGKSAITDIICLCGNTKQWSNFSFLTPNKFRKKIPVNLSEKFTATLEWEDGTSETKKLSDDPNRLSVEKVKYIPQNFLEQICAEVESDEFEKEIKNIIFSHTPLERRLGKETLDELINYRSDIVVDEIGVIKNELSRLNSDIASLEEKNRTEYRTIIENKLESKRSELKAHAAKRPTRSAVGSISKESSVTLESLEEIRAKITSTEEEITKKKRLQGTLNVKSAELEKASQIFENLEKELNRLAGPESEAASILKTYDIDISKVIKYNINTGPISSVAEQTITELDGLASLFDVTNSEGLTYKLAALNETLRKAQEDLDRPAREEQRFLNELNDWAKKEKEIEGSFEVDGSIKNLEMQLEYLEKKLPASLQQKIDERRNLLEKLYDEKASLREIRKELFSPLTEFIEGLRDLKEKYDVQIDVGLELDSFAERFFSLVNQGRSGTFCGKEEGSKQLTSIVESTSFETKDGFIKFAEALIAHLSHDKRTSDETEMDIESQLRKGVGKADLYDFIFHFDYLKPVYNLKMGKKYLKELSPGERGALLLIFYLILDTDDIPLIIDQPEENLDNESVYYILVHFIKQVKERRQIFIVTHNPNLAIVCDADQIVEMQIEKENHNIVKFNSGAIEDETMNIVAVNILEGTFAALNNRYSKYHKRADVT